MTLTRTPPPLSTTSAAVLLSATLAILFVASLYVLGSVRGADGKALRRNDARVVRQRMVAVAVACLGSVAVVQWALAVCRCCS